MQPVQDLTVEDRVSRTQYQYIDGRYGRAGTGDVVAEARREAADIAAIARRRQRSAERAACRRTW